MILYFSATGNTHFVAELIAEKLNDELVSINDILKQGKPLVFRSEKPFVIASPIYAWRLPARIEELLKSAEFQGSKKIYIVATMGASAGAAGEYCRRIITKKGLEYMGFYAIRMPDNYTVSFKMPSKDKSIERIRKSIPDIENAAAKIEAEKAFDKRNSGRGNAVLCELTKIVNAGFNRFMINKGNFAVSDKCIGCGVCSNLCPVNNIKIQNGKAVFEKECMFCLACLHGCPTHAIDYKGKAKKNGYYSCPKRSEVI